MRADDPKVLSTGKIPLNSRPISWGLTGRPKGYWVYLGDVGRKLRPGRSIGLPILQRANTSRCF